MKLINHNFLILFLILFSCVKQKPRPTFVVNDYLTKSPQNDSLNTLLTLLHEPLINRNQDSSLNIFRLTFFSKSNWLYSKVIRIEKYNSDSVITIYPNLPDSNGTFGGVEMMLSFRYWDTLQTLLTAYDFDNLPFSKEINKNEANSDDFYFLEESKNGEYHSIIREFILKAESEDDKKLQPIIEYINNNIRQTQ